MEIVKWFDNHSRALSLLRIQQEKHYGKVLMLIRPPVTRWTACYLTVNRILEIENALRVCAFINSQQLIACGGTERAQKDKAEELVNELQSPTFWQNLTE